MVRFIYSHFTDQDINSKKQYENYLVNIPISIVIYQKYME